jgi:hypothetical protein
MDPNAGCLLAAVAGYRMMGQKHNEEITEEVEITHINTTREMPVLPLPIVSTNNLSTDLCLQITALQEHSEIMILLKRQVDRMSIITIIV